MKDYQKTIRLAVVGGSLGLHRFYLGQTGKGIACVLWTLLMLPYALLSGDSGTFGSGLLLTFAPSIFTGVLMLLRSQEQFDEKYNKQAIQKEILNSIKNK
jgi:TM2 domain-containing membrane protein YozV